MAEADGRDEARGKGEPEATVEPHGTGKLHGTGQPRGAADRDELVAFLDDLLDVSAFQDYGPNGLQVPGAREVRTVVTGVSAQRELFERAEEEGAQMVLCHHGLIWDGGPAVVTERMKGRLETLFRSDISLAAYHLPLDAHPEVGNNALLCAELGLRRGEGFGDVRGRPIGLLGHADEELAASELVERCRSVTGREPLVVGDGPDRVRRVGVVTGAGASVLDEAVARGLDAFVTGEPAERVMADSREAAMHFVAAGHYATETFGVRRLGELVAERFGVEHRFVDVPNPI
ncbi:MAG TPA: Nif3-like dinuclear metal center hexameric protein [Thermoleophilaceae bacterium]|nr:Nif3-like dinuclear metal center hexameric protein [Thermoleophilaceae bacterium]